MALTDQLGRLAAFEPAPYPVVSLYLNTQPGQTGRDQFQAFIRKEFKARGRTYPAGSPEAESLERDLERIAQHLETELQPTANGLAIFACSAGELFEVVQLDAALDRHFLYVGDQPHLYPLARLESQNPTYAALLVDTNTARILVISSGHLVTAQGVEGVKTRATSQGGWSQSRYQRHISNYHQQHVKEVVDALDRIVSAERINHIIVAGDEVVTPILRDQMPKHLADKIIDQVRLATHAPLQDVLTVSLESMRRMNERTDREKVDAAINAYRAGGLGVVGPEDTLSALIKGQVEELLLAATMREMRSVPMLPADEAAVNDSAIAEPVVGTAAAGEAADARPEIVRLADELVTRATQTGARITFIEDASALGAYGGVAALLRFRV